MPSQRRRVGQGRCEPRRMEVPRGCRGAAIRGSGHAAGVDPD
ncbi:hypothetical protein GLA29479_3427 [Lysobacter antibioticus]|nr:hypothetical protein GLA29479_3427 [Lysobacter antibioticus]